MVVMGVILVLLTILLSTFATKEVAKSFKGRVNAVMCLHETASSLQNTKQTIVS